MKQNTGLTMRYLVSFLIIFLSLPTISTRTHAQLSPSKTCVSERYVNQLSHLEKAYPDTSLIDASKYRGQKLSNLLRQAFDSTKISIKYAEPAGLERAALALAQATSHWTPTITPKDALRLLGADINDYGVVSGQLLPLVEMIDWAYMVFPEEKARRLSSLLNPAVAEINPSVARLLCKSLDIPIEWPKVEMLKSTKFFVTEYRRRLIEAGLDGSWLKDSMIISRPNSKEKTHLTRLLETLRDHNSILQHATLRREIATQDASDESNGNNSGKLNTTTDKTLLTASKGDVKDYQSPKKTS